MVPFKLDEHLVPITINLSHALWQLKKHEHTLVWVDCLCIDQSYSTEKSAQILSINVVYREAELVVSWLGLAADGSDSIMRAMTPGVTGSKVSQLYLNRPGKLYDFLDRSYWRRAWVVQEIIAGSRVEFLCGQMSAHWEAFDDLLAIVRSQPTRCHRYKQILYLSNARRIQSDGGTPSSLLEVLHNTSTTLSSDPNDKIYAVLGPAFDFRLYISEPKYGLTPDELCMSMTKSFIRSKRVLDIMFLAPNVKASSSDDTLEDADTGYSLPLPSWCPNYLNLGSFLFTSQMSRYVSGQEERIRCGIRTRLWSTTGGSKVDLKHKWLDRNIAVRKRTSLGRDRLNGCNSPRT